MIVPVLSNITVSAFDNSSIKLLPLTKIPFLAAVFIAAEKATAVESLIPQE